MLNVAILSFSEIARDARVLRQLRLLEPHAALTVLGFGAVPEGVFERPLAWHDLNHILRVTPPHVHLPQPAWRRRLQTYAYYLRRGEVLDVAREELRGPVWLDSHLGRLLPAVYERWYWREPLYRDTWDILRTVDVDLIHANDWTMLPLAIRYAEERGARVVFDAHEYAPLQAAHLDWWDRRFPHVIQWLLETYAPRADAFLTVCDDIAERYATELGVEPVVVFNAPERVALRERATHDGFELVHHGGASPHRHLDLMVRAVGLSQEDTSLHFRLVGDPDYVDSLRALADDVAPGRVHFHDPVPPRDIVPTIARHDAGIYPLRPVNYNHEVALPNKVFDFVAAELPLIIGPTPGMRRFVDEHGVGVVAASFEPADLAIAIDELARADRAPYRERSRVVADRINAETEGEKLMAVYERLGLKPTSAA